MMGTWDWRVVSCSDLELLEDIAVAVQRPSGDKKGFGTNHDWSWLGDLSVSSGKTLQVMVLQQGDDVVGYAPFLHHPVGLDFRLGETTIFSVPVRRAALEGGPVINWTRFKGDRNECLLGLLQSLHAEIGDTNVVFLGAIPIETQLYHLLSKPEQLRGYFHVVPHGDIYQRRLASLRDDYDSYLAFLGRRTRNDLRRTRKRFSDELGERARVRVYQSPDDIDLFLSNAKSVSRKTYQWHLLGQRIQPGGSLEARLRTAARRGRLLAYLLYIDGEPVAFQVGYNVGGVYSAHETGYDPAWRKLQPGIYLLTEIFMDLSSRPGIELFDFQVGDSLHKKRLSNLSHEERHFYLFPWCPRGALLAHAMRIVDATSATAGKLLRLLGLGEAVKSRLRRRSTVGARTRHDQKGPNP